MVGRGIGGDAEAAERRLAEALGAHASLAAAPAAPATPTGATRASHPSGPRRAVPSRSAPTRRRQPARSGSAAAVPARPGARTPTVDSAVRLRRALLVALLAGVLLGCGLALLSLLVPGLLPALG